MNKTMQPREVPADGFVHRDVLQLVGVLRIFSKHFVQVTHASSFLLRQHLHHAQRPEETGGVHTVAEVGDVDGVGFVTGVAVAVFDSAMTMLGMVTSDMDLKRGRRVETSKEARQSKWVRIE